MTPVETAETETVADAAPVTRRGGKRPGAGRHTRPDFGHIVDTVVDALSHGATLKMAAAAAGISPATINAWMQPQRHKGAVYAEARARITAARERRCVLDLQAISRAADGGRVMVQAERQVQHPRREIRHPDGRVEIVEPYAETIPPVYEYVAGDWRAGAWRVERMFPDDFGRRTITHAGPGGGPVQIEVGVRDRARSMSDDELHRLALEDVDPDDG